MWLVLDWGGPIGLGVLFMGIARVRNKLPAWFIVHDGRFAADSDDRRGIVLKFFRRRKK